jgi:Biopolymer transport protein ExbD/TolR.
MARKKKDVPEISGTGQSDISFLLICFFLMTSSMDQSMGLNRRLPPMPTGEEIITDIKGHNVLQVLVDGQDRISVNGRTMDIGELRGTAKEFILNPTNSPSKSSKKAKDIAGLGSVQVSEAVISMQNVRSTSYDTYLSVQNELVAAYNELRNEESVARFNRKFNDLNDRQREIIVDIYPQRISEAPPKDTRKKK